MTEIIPLGTGSAVPVQGRGFSAVAVRRAESALLFDCGEGTQMRLLDAGIKLSRVRAVFVTHLHGDHFFGLMGLLATMSLVGRGEPLLVVGPHGIRHLLESIPGLAPLEMSFSVEFVEIDTLDTRIPVMKERGFRVWASPLDHGVPAYGYRYQEDDRPGHLDVERARSLGVERPEDYGLLKSGQSVKGSAGVVESSDVVGPSLPGGVFAYVTDTRPCPGAVELARNADILYHEATFADKLSDRAASTGHSTAREAARVAARAGARRLLLAHFSARYTQFDDLIREARGVFPETEAAQELMRYPLQNAALLEEKIG